ncbi:MAG: FGGY family carbohydrate kinase [Candidatus Humimicrobiaceae bacterium]
MDNKNYFILAIDCGSTNLKAAIFDRNLNRISENSIPLEYSINDIERVEFEADKTYDSLIELFRKSCRDAGIKTSNVNAISIDSQANTFSIVDKKCKPVIPFISYLDGRAVLEAEILDSLYFSKDFNHGIKTPWSTLSKVLWLKNHNPDVLKYPNSIVTIPGYFTCKLIGINAIDQNLAAMEGFYSIEEGDWNIKIINYLQMEKNQFPKLFKVGTPIKPFNLNKSLDLNRDLEIVLSGNDQTASAFGNSSSDNHVMISLGTSLVVYRNMGQKKGPYNKEGSWGLYPFGGFYELYASNFGTHSLDWAMNFLNHNSDIEYFKTCAKESALIKSRYETDMNNEIKNYLFFYPEKIGDENAWIGNYESSINDKALAVMEGLSFCLKQILMEFLKIKIERYEMLVTGGGSKNKIWMQILANTLNTKIVKAKRDALFGCARMVSNSMQINNNESEHYLPEQTLVSKYEIIYKEWLKYKK